MSLVTWYTYRMELLTGELRTKLEANHEATLAVQRQRYLGEAGDELSEPDHEPVVEFFVPGTAATWLVTELLPDGDTLFGLADMGVGFPELGYFSLSELAGLCTKSGFRVERELYFETEAPISVYAETARELGSLSEAIMDLEAQTAAATRQSQTLDMDDVTDRGFHYTVAELETDIDLDLGSRLEL